MKGAAAELAVIDDDEAVLDSMRVLLEGHGLAVRTFGSAEAFLDTLEAEPAPTCIVCDVRMQGMSGLELNQELKRRGIASPLILVTGHGQVSMAVAALKAGAADFIEKPFDESTLVNSIRHAMDTAARDLELQRSRSAIAERASQLSARQRQVMDLVVKGLSSKEIAADLQISPRTVETYRLWIMEKMGARNLADLVRMVLLLEGTK